MVIPQVVLKKWVIFSIAGVAGTAIAVTMVYTLLNSNTGLNQPVATTTKAVAPNPTNFNVTFSNVIADTPKKEASQPTTAIVVPAVTATHSQPLLTTLMQSTPVGEATTTQGTTKTPGWYIENTQVANNNQGTNDITGTNTSIGTGVINSQLTAQRSPYTLFAGTFLPATLVTDLNSDLNGEVVAIVNTNVYDSTNAKYLLIPQGSKLLGVYNHNVAYGQNRLMVGWNRVIYPNGTSFLLHGQPGTDLSGMSGFTGDVDNHYVKVFGSAFMMGLIFGGTTMAVGNQGTNPSQISAGATIASQVGAQMGQAGIQIVNKGLNIPPTIVISKGYRFNILTTSDLILKPYIYKG
jgi:type IV secretory pathway VirB10-like protein